MKIREQVRKKIAEVLGTVPAKIDDDDVLTDLVTSSFVLVETVIELQEEFGVRFQQADLTHVVTVGELLDLVVDRMAKVRTA